MTEFLARVGDRINPIVVKETRQAVNSRLVAGFLLLFLGVQLIVMFLMIAGRELGRGGEVDLRAGRDMFTFVQGILLGTCMVLIPALTGVRLAVERSDVNVDLLFISSLTPRAVVAGKLVAAGALALLIFSACAPFMTFAYVMRGLDVPTILVVLTADYLAVMASTALAVFLASVPANRGLRIFLGVAGFVAMCYMGAALLAGSSAFLRYGAGFETAEWEFWAGFAGVATLVVGAIGLLFVWSVALISPAAANRAYPVRVYTLAFWAASAVGFGAWSLHLSRPEPMLGWGMVGCILFSLQFAISVCERDGWGARVARRIPRSPLLRVPAFSFYSGAAGGIAFGVIGATLTTFGLAAWYAAVPTTRSYGLEERPIYLVALVPAYTYCYCLTAALVRRALAGSALYRPGFTWLVGLILLGAGCIMPFLVRFALFDRPSYGRDEMTGLYVTNPFVMILDAIDRTDSHVALTIFFLIAWGGLVTAFNAPWLVRQALAFHPPRAGGAEESDERDEPRRRPGRDEGGEEEGDE